MKEAAGILIYRNNPDIEIILVHPSGNYNAKATWSIPKGHPEKNEPLEDAARREVLEETSVIISNQIQTLGFIDYKKSKKRVYCWMSEAPENCQPKCNSWEVDQVAFLSINEARKLIHPDQAIFIDRLCDKLKT